MDASSKLSCTPSLKPWFCSIILSKEEVKDIMGDLLEISKSITKIKSEMSPPVGDTELLPVLRYSQYLTF